MSQQLIVAIGRESGSGGLDIAHALAERLQLPLFDKSILQKAAEDKGVSAQTLERYDERPYPPCSAAPFGASAAPRRIAWPRCSLNCCASTPTPENPSWCWAAAPRRCWRTGKG